MELTAPKTICIDCASAFWGDTSTAVAQVGHRRSTQALAGAVGDQVKNRQILLEVE